MAMARRVGRALFAVALLGVAHSAIADPVVVAAPGGVPDRSRAAAPATVSAVAVSPPAITALATPMPADSVRCVYDKLSLEDREITLMLTAINFIDQGRYARIRPPNPIVDRLVLQAVPPCAAAYRWPAAASSAAVAFAHAVLAQEVVRQALDLEQRQVDAIESYYTANRAALAGHAQLDEMMEEGFVSHLKQAGWKERDREPRQLARVYLGLLAARDRSEQDFAKAAAPQRPVRVPARRARTTARDRR